MKKQKEAREKLTVSEKQISSQITPTVGSNQINTAAPQQSTSKNQSRADRLAELRKQSQESIKKTESILEPSVSTAVEPEIATLPTVPNVVAKEIKPATSSPVVDSETSAQKNVFKKITRHTCRRIIFRT